MDGQQPQKVVPRILRWTLYLEQLVVVAGETMPTLSPPVVIRTFTTTN